MRYLLDTHAFLWFSSNDPRLGTNARQAIIAATDPVYVSIASLWEIAIKVGLGKLSLNAPFDLYVPREMSRNGLQLLAIALDHLSAVARLPMHHRDPFDRLLVAQAMAESVPILSADSALDAYGITRLW